LKVFLDVSCVVVSFVCDCFVIPPKCSNNIAFTLSGSRGISPTDSRTSASKEHTLNEQLIIILISHNNIINQTHRPNNETHWPNNQTPTTIINSSYQESP